LTCACKPESGTREPKPGADPIESPPHYVAGRAIEPIDVIEDWGLPHHLACALKYIARHGRKDADALGLEKAEWYLRRYREHCKSMVPRADKSIVHEPKAAVDVRAVEPGDLSAGRNHRSGSPR
jgi:hypothetical protein